MKWSGWILVLSLLASPAWAAKKISVQQLKELMVSLQQTRKTDPEVATELKQVELTEELTRSGMNGLVNYLPGRLSTEQIYVLEARSAMLPPPASDLPTTPAPDAAAQKALLDKALNYATKTYAQLPEVIGTKTTVRFQDDVSAMLNSSGMHSGAIGDSGANPDLINASLYIHYINTAQAPVDIHSGIEDNPLVKDKTRWGMNGFIALLGQGPVLSTVLEEANAADKFAWLRWETVNGKNAAVFSFAVDKKKSHYAVNYCCFPDLETAGLLRYSTPSGPGANPQARGNMQTATDWKNYKTTVPYHGEVFIDPDTGVVVRLITQADFKNTELVHQEDQRIDFLPVAVGGKTLVLPAKSIIDTEVVPNGDSGGGRYIARHTLFTAEYKDYKLSSADHK